MKWCVIAAFVTVMCSGARADAQNYCWIQFPDAASVAAGGDTFTVFGQIYIPGLTDLSPGVDPNPSVIVQAGVGPNGSNPSVSLAGWAFQTASPTPGWSDPFFYRDEYVANVVSPPLLGSYDYAYRFSTNFGATFTYCDTPSGNTYGYQSANAGSLDVLSSTVSPVPILPLPIQVLLIAALLGICSGLTDRGTSAPLAARASRWYRRS